MRLLPDANELDRAAGLRQRADAALAADDGALAEELLREAHLVDPADDDAALLLAKICFDRGDWAGCTGWIDTALRARPFHPTALNFVGILARECGEARLGRSCFKAALRQAPGFVAAKRSLRAGQAQPVRRPPGRSTLIATIRKIVQHRPGGLAVAVVADESAGALERTLSNVPGWVDQLRVVGLGHVPDCSGMPGPADRAAGAILRAQDVATACDRAVAACDREWVLLLHAGETLEHEDWGGLRAESSRNRALFASCRVRLAHRQEARLFRNAPRLRFDGLACPDPRRWLLAMSLNWGLPGRELDVDVHRHGPPLTARVGVDRGLESRWWAELHRAAPDDWLAPAMTSLLSRGESGASTEALQRGFDRAESARNPFLLQPALLASAASHLEAGRADQARDLLDSLGSCGASRRDALELRCRSALACGDPHRAAEAAEALARSPEDAFGTPAAPLARELRYRVAQHLLDSGQFEPAIDLLDRVTRGNDADADGLLALLGAMLVAGRSDGIPEILERVAGLEPAEPTTWLKAGRMLDGMPQLPELSACWWQEASVRFPSERSFGLHWVDALIAAGDRQAAVAQLAQLDGLDASTLAVERVGLALLGEAGPAEPADADAEQVLKAVERWSRSWALCGVLDRLEQQVETIAAADRQVPGLLDALLAGVQEAIGADAATSLRRALDA